MDKNIGEISKRIKDLRLLSDYTAKETAEKLGVALAEYEAFEGGAREIPIGMIYNIAATFKVNPTFLFTGEENSAVSVFPVYEGEGKEITRHPGYKFTSLAAGFEGRLFEPMIVEIEAGVEPELLHHSGQEFNYVLEGALRVLIAGREYYLRKGESIFFNPTAPHAQVAMDGKPAKFLTVILEK